MAVETLRQLDIEPTKRVDPVVRQRLPQEAAIDFSAPAARKAFPIPAWNTFRKRLEGSGQMRDGEYLGTTRGIAEMAISLRRNAIKRMFPGEERDDLLRQHRLSRQQMRHWNKAAGLHTK